MFNFKNAEQFKEECGYDIDGAWYPRVTKIVSIKSKPALFNFYAEMKSVKAGQAVSEQSAQEGTMIHTAVEALLLGQIDVEIPEIIRPAVEGFIKFSEKNHIETEQDFVERRIISYEHRYAGTVDAVAKIGGKRGVLDIKTSQAIYRDYNLQTAAYFASLKDSFEDLETRWILRIDQNQFCTRCGSKRRVKGGREKIKPNGHMSCPPKEHAWSETKAEIEIKEFPSWQSDFEAFLAAKRLWEWENEYWLKQIGYL